MGPERRPPSPAAVLGLSHDATVGIPVTPLFYTKRYPTNAQCLKYCSVLYIRSTSCFMSLLLLECYSFSNYKIGVWRSSYPCTPWLIQHACSAAALPLPSLANASPAATRRCESVHRCVASRPARIAVSSQPPSRLAIPMQSSSSESDAPMQLWTCLSQGVPRQQRCVLKLCAHPHALLLHPRSPS